MVKVAATAVVSSVLTAVAFFVIGVIRGYVLEKQPFTAGLETLGIGGAAAVVAYAVGKLLEQVAQ